jgi:hypothetical protein
MQLPSVSLLDRRAPLSLVPQRPPASGAPPDGGVGIRVQDHVSVVQGSQGRRARWEGSWVLLSRRNRAATFWCPRASEDPCAGAPPSQHSDLPQEGTLNQAPVVYEVVQSCSPGPYLELFARRTMPNWVAWGDEVDTYEQQKPRYRECDWGIEIPLTLDELWDRYRGPGRLDPRTFWRDCQGG